MTRCRVAIDAAGGDHGCAPAVGAALEMADRCDIVLVGPPDEIERCAGGPLPPSVTVVPASQAVRMDDDPVKAVRDLRNSSVMLTARAVAAGDADLMITAGNTGAAVVAASVQFGRAPGIAHPALAVVLPSPLGGTQRVMLDVGAAVACKPDWLVQFADLGVAYHRARMGSTAPKVALLSNGSEQGKGGALRAEAHALLGKRDDYIGQIEGHNLLTTEADVVVTDGLTGNVALKTIEGAVTVTAKVLVEAARRISGASGPDRAAWLAALHDAVYVDGGGVLLGLRHLCIVCHGASEASDLRMAIDFGATCWERWWSTPVAS